MALILAGNLSAQVVDRNPSNVISTAKKLIIVTTPDWKSVGGTMLRYERRKNTWKQVGTPIDVVVGRNGMAWDPSLTAELKKYPDWIKREGDGRSPAGFFRIARKFGFAPKISKNDFYLPITPTTECVDDVNSKYYNQIVDRL